MQCHRCFPGNAGWGDAYHPAIGWQLERNPCAWGSTNPRVLVLGFSKGTNQTAALSTANFDDVPFKGMRNKISDILRTLGFFAHDQRVEDHINSDLKDFAFGSLIRCAISKFDAQTGRYVKSGDVIKTLATKQSTNDFVSDCVARFLAKFPSRLRHVVMLSNDDTYIAILRRFIATAPSKFPPLEPGRLRCRQSSTYSRRPSLRQQRAAYQ